MIASSMARFPVRHSGAHNWKCRRVTTGLRPSTGQHSYSRETTSKLLNLSSSCTIVKRVMSATSGSGPGPFEKLLCWLSPDRGMAIEKYTAIRKKIIRYFVRKAVGDPDELFDQTTDRVIRLVDSDREYPVPDALFYRVAELVWREYYRKVRPVPLEVDLPDPAPPDTDKEVLAQCLDQCLTDLPVPDRDLISEWHQYTGRLKIQTRKQLALKYGGQNAVRIRVHRIGRRVRICIEKCVSQRAVN